MDELEEEIEQLRERNEYLESQIDLIKDKYEQQIAELEDKGNLIKLECDREWKLKLQTVEADCRDKIKVISDDLDKMRSAFSGDSSGWVAKTKPNGKQIYENIETGEVRDEMPEVLYVANLINKADEAEKNLEELQTLRKKIKDSEATRKEAELYINKAKLEVNQLRAKDREWKGSAASIQRAFEAANETFNEQFKQLDGRLAFLTDTKDRMGRNAVSSLKVKEILKTLQTKLANQDNQIRTFNTKISKLVVEIEEKSAKIARLSEGIDDEVERISKPLRDKVSEFMTLVMKEKAARAQERRELADLWPDDHMMPTVLLRHRALSHNERKRRLQRTKTLEAQRALTLEIQANVAESKLWEVAYDDYGRQFFKHTKTAQISWERPAIMDYKPPPGRDEFGNFVATEDFNPANWTLETDMRGEVFYKNKETGQTQYDAPESFVRITPSKEPEMIIAEAANLVLTFVKEKMKQHERNLKGAEQYAAALAEARKNKLPDPEPFEPDLSNTNIFNDLSLFLYDLDTVEMLAKAYQESKERGRKKKPGEVDPETIELDRLKKKERPKKALTLSTLSKGLDGAVPPSITDVDQKTVSEETIRGALKANTDLEEQLQTLITQVRENLKEFSFLLLEKMNRKRKSDLEALEAKVFREEERRLRALEKSEAENKLRKAEEILAEREAQRVEALLPKRFRKREVAEVVEEVEVETESKRLRRTRLDNLMESEHPDLSQYSGTADDPVAANFKSDEVAPVPDAISDDQSLGKTSSVSVPIDPPLVASSLDVGKEIVPPYDSYSPQVVQMVEDLVHVALFCGFSKTNINDLDEKSVGIGIHTINNMLQHSSIDVSNLEIEENRLREMAKEKEVEHVVIQALGVEPSMINGIDAEIEANEEAAHNEDVDDNWLSKNFFISMQAEAVDSVKTATTRPLIPALEARGLKPVEHSKIDIFNSNENEDGNSVTVSGSHLQCNIEEVHEMWKERQFFGEILRYQIQREANKATFSQSAAISASTRKIPVVNTATDRLLVEVSILNATAIGLISSSSRVAFKMEERSYSIRISLGPWSCLVGNGRFEEDSLGDIVSWGSPTINFSGKLSMEEVRVGEQFRIEIHEKSPMNEAIVALASLPPMSLLNHNMGEMKTIDIQLYGGLRPEEKNSMPSSATSSAPASPRDGEQPKEASSGGVVEVNIAQPLCVLRLTIMASGPASELVSPPEFDALSQAIEEVPLPKQEETPVIQESVRLSNAGADNMSVDGQDASDVTGHDSRKEGNKEFSDLVSALRGDGLYYVRSLIGAVYYEDIKKISSKDSPVSSNVKKIPNLTKVRSFLNRKKDLQRSLIYSLHADVETMYETIEKILREKHEAASAQLKAISDKFTDHKKSVDILQKDFKDIMERLDTCRNPPPKPPDPFPEPQAEPKYVPDIPKTGGLNDKGKKKKELKNPDMKAILDSIKAGEMDFGEWDFGDRWPGPLQMQQLILAKDARNKALDEEHAAEAVRREKAYEVYRQDLAQWDIADRARQREYDQVKKESRKLYLRYDLASDRANRTKADMMSQAEEVNCWSKFMDMHRRSKTKYRVHKCKQMVESERIEALVKRYQTKLLALLDARRRALELPAGAISLVHFGELQQMAEISLATIRFEIVECRQQLVNAGNLLRALYKEEIMSVQSEASRLRTLRQLAIQRTSIDKIIERHRVEVHNLLKDIEKLKVIEADKDDLGLVGTIDDKGERYSPDRKWSGKDINSALKALSFLQAKIDLVNSIRDSAGECQTNLMENMSLRWNNDDFMTDDAWTPNSEVVAANQRVEEMKAWVASQHDKLLERQYALDRREADVEAEINAIKKFLDGNNVRFEAETGNIKESTLSIVDSIRNRMVELENATKDKIYRLEDSITELSKECQQVREEKNQQAYDLGGRVETLMSFIATLQSTLERMTNVVAIMEEETEHAVLTASLQVDRMRHELRMERKHCSNLLFIVHGQRAAIHKMLHDEVKREEQHKQREMKDSEEKRRLRHQNWEQLFTFARLCTDVDDLFEFFVTRLANLAGSRKSVNDAMRRNGAAAVFAVMCRSPRPLIRKCATRCLGGMGWDGYVETRILMWDAVLQWKLYKERILAGENSFYDPAKEYFVRTGKIEAVLELPNVVNTDEFTPNGSMSVRTIVRQRRQYALRAARRFEGPNMENMKLLNVKDFVVKELIDLCRRDGENDWEILRNAVLALSVASFDERNHVEMAQDQPCVDLLVDFCMHEDPEIQTHAAVAIANLCYNNEEGQIIFGKSGAFEALLKMCQTPIADVVEAATAALSNITCNSDANCRLFMDAGGIPMIVSLVVNSHTENLLDLDQSDEIQSNASEILANATRFNFQKIAELFDQHVINTIVYMVASPNKNVRRHAPLVLGNISQTAECRVRIGDGGGVEALFLAVEDKDPAVQANALWAMCNLMWHPSNQERAGRFMQEIVNAMNAEWAPVKGHAALLLSNVLYYNTPNRTRLLEIDGSMELLLKNVHDRSDKLVMEGSLRSMLSMSYVDEVAIWLGAKEDGDAIPLLISLLEEPVISREVVRYSLETLCNLCVHHSNRMTILNNQGIEHCMNLMRDTDPHIVEVANQILKHLEDITPKEVIAAAKSKFSIDALVALSTADDPMVRALVAETLGEEVWHDASKQRLLNKLGGIPALLRICSRPDESITAVLPAIWSLRNLLYRNAEGQNQFCDNDGMKIISDVMGKCFLGAYSESSDKVMEACLGCIVNALVDHEKNARKLLVTGLDHILDLAEGESGARNVYRVQSSYLKAVFASESIPALAKNVLEMLGPYNYVVCRNCGKRQNLTGNNCILCGRILLMDPSVDASASPKKSSFKDKKFRIDAVAKAYHYH